MIASCFDVACYILEKTGPISAMKLQKLVYYSQAWSLVWDERPLFTEQIEAWANGPVTRVLYNAHQGQFMVDASLFRARCSGNALDLNSQETIDIVLDHYGEKSGHWLSVQTHNESPWKDARGSCGEGERCDTPITHAAMAEYYAMFSA